MTRPCTDVQVFHHSGVWRKPAGALAVDTVFLAATAGPEDEPQTRTDCLPADSLPAVVNVEVSEPAPGGRPGCAIVVSHLMPPRLPGSGMDPHDIWLV